MGEGRWTTTRGGDGISLTRHRLRLAATLKAKTVRDRLPALLTVILLALCVGPLGPSLGPASSLAAQEVAASEPPQPAWLAGIGARLQLQHSWEHPDNHHTTRVRRGRIWARGLAANRFGYTLQAELAGDELQLLDAQVSTHLAGPVHLWLGQGKVPFGRQQLNSSGALSLVDRSVADGRFTPARRVGVKLHGAAMDDHVTFALGRFEARGIGGGPGVPGRSMVAGRLVWTPLGAYPTVESPLRIPDGPRLALGVAGLSTSEERGGHRARVSRWAGEGALRMGRLQVVTEAFREEGSSVVAPEEMAEGGLDQGGMARLEYPGAWGGHLQVGLLSRDLAHEVVVRHALIRPDASGHSTGVEPGVNDEPGVSETGVGYTRYLDGHRTKVQADIHRISRDSDLPTEARIRLQLTMTLW